MKRLCILSLVFVLAGNVAFAATVSCEVKSVNGSTIILENCDEKRVKDFQKGNKVKIKLVKNK